MGYFQGRTVNLPEGHVYIQILWVTCAGFMTCVSICLVYRLETTGLSHVGIGPPAGGSGCLGRWENPNVKLSSLQAYQD